MPNKTVNRVLENPNEYNLRRLYRDAVIREENIAISKIHSALRKKVKECTCYSCSEESERDVMPEPVAYAAVFDVGSVVIKLFKTEAEAEGHLIELVNNYIQELSNSGSLRAQRARLRIQNIFESNSPGRISRARSLFRDEFSNGQHNIDILPIME